MKEAELTAKHIDLQNRHLALQDDYLGALRDTETLRQERHEARALLARLWWDVDADGVSAELFRAVGAKLKEWDADGIDREEEPTIGV